MKLYSPGFVALIENMPSDRLRRLNITLRSSSSTKKSMTAFLSCVESEVKYAPLKLTSSPSLTMWKYTYSCYGFCGYLIGLRLYLGPEHDLRLEVVHDTCPLPDPLVPVLLVTAVLHGLRLLHVIRDILDLLWGHVSRLIW